MALHSRDTFLTNQYILLLQQCNWLQKSMTAHENSLDSSFPNSNYKFSNLIDRMDSKLLKNWTAEIKIQENQIAISRRNALNPDQQIQLTKIYESETSTTYNDYVDNTIHDTIIITKNHGDLTSVEPQSIINKIGKEYMLNEKQWIAFHIITQYFVQKFVIKEHPSKHLCMLITGPGGTGKTHVVHAVKAVMEHYNCAHIIRFLAPTGSAANMIDGMTIHKGLGIKIKSQKRGKGNREVGESEEDYSVIISVKNRTHLRNEWRNVEFVLIDETSLLSLQLLAEIDHALRFAKEKPDVWFGGIAIIFAGDLFQYPPVGGSPLYTPIKPYANQTNDEIQKRLGRLAWKTMNTVVNFTEQQRMKNDTEFGFAVARLRVRKCTYADVDLFNTRVTKSFNNPDGIDMGLPANFDACAIVTTNSLREALNEKKTEVSSSLSEIINCYAQDKCSNKPLTLHDRQHLLQLDMNGMHSSKSLPNLISFYVGMPVILRTRNLSTDLGITNGSQGIVRQIFTEQCSLGFKYGSCVIVEFPYSKVHLSHLPPKHFPITPITWIFTTLLKDINNSQQKLRIIRSQLPIQPAFAVTGHSAQGKTLPKIIVNLANGGFAAYVAASRATTREGLCITEPVTIQQLNKPLPHDLLHEVRRLESIEHNTLITYGFQSGSLVPVPDLESEHSLSHKTHRIEFVQERINKRKKKTINENDSNTEDIDNEAHTQNSSQHVLKRAKTVSSKADFLQQKQSSQSDSFASIQSLSTPIGAGCQWSSTNWSCAYDTVFMALFHTYQQINPLCRQTWTINSNDIGKSLSLLFDRLLETNSNLNSSSLFNISRDQFRDRLSMHDPHSFPRFGMVGASTTSILELISPSCKLIATTLCTNDACNKISQIEERVPISLPTICFPIQTQNQDPITLQKWLEEWLANQFRQHNNKATFNHNLPNCDGTASTSLQLPFAPSVLFLETIESATPIIPSLTLTIPIKHGLTAYRLSGIIYQGDFHFSARIIYNEPTFITYTYDGRNNNGYPALENPLQHLYNDLLHLDNRRIHVLLYSPLFHDT